jgi:hypothetical protein
MNPNVPQFAFHTVVRGFGWVTPKGNFTWSMDLKLKIEDTYTPKDSKQEISNGTMFLSSIYEAYKLL